MDRLEFHDNRQNSHKFYELALGLRFPEEDGLPVGEVRVYSRSRVNRISQACYTLGRQGADPIPVLRLWVQEIAKVLELEIWRNGVTPQTVDALLAGRFELTPLGIYGRVGTYGRRAALSASVANMSRPWITCLNACDILSNKRIEKLHQGYAVTRGDAGAAAEVPEPTQEEKRRLSGLTLDDLEEIKTARERHKEDLAALAEAASLMVPGSDRVLML